MEKTQASAKPVKQYKKSWLYAFALVLYRALFYVFLGGRIRGQENVPASGALVLMCNHIHALDPFTMAICAPRRQPHFMGKKELFRNKLLDKLFRKLHAFPVDRGQSDLAAMREGMAVLRAGEVLGIFPEGTRGDGEHLGELLSGAALLALRSAAAVSPLYIYGKYRLFGRLRVAVGKPIDVADLRANGVDKEGADAFSGRVRAALEELREECTKI